MLKKPEGDLWEWELHWSGFEVGDAIGLMFFHSAHCVMCHSPLSWGLRFFDQLRCHFSCMSSLIPTPHITCNSPSPFQVPCFLSISRLSHTQFIMSSAVSDLNAGCRAVTNSCTLLLTMLFFTATATHMHPSRCQYCIACSSWTDYTLQWRQHDHRKCQEPSISECSATYRRFWVLSVHVVLWLSLCCVL